MHAHYIEDTRGDVVDEVLFCSDFCHRTWCVAAGLRYGGWNGALEGSTDYAQFCEQCGAPANDVAHAEAYTVDELDD